MAEKKMTFVIPVPWTDPIILAARHELVKDLNAGTKYTLSFECVAGEGVGSIKVEHA